MTLSSAGAHGRPPGTPTAAGEDPLSELAPAFKGAMASVRRLRARERAHPGELRDAQYALLFGLCDRDSLPSSELAHLADLTPASATELLDELEAEGLVARTRSERDRRVVLVSLTEPGQHLVRHHRAQREPRWRAAFSQFSDEEIRSAVTVLVRMQALFEELASER